MPPPSVESSNFFLFFLLLRDFVLPFFFHYNLEEEWRHPLPTNSTHTKKKPLFFFCLAFDPSAAIWPVITKSFNVPRAIGSKWRRWFFFFLFYELFFFSFSSSSSWLVKQPVADGQCAQVTTYCCCWFTKWIYRQQQQQQVDPWIVYLKRKTHTQ